MLTGSLLLFVAIFAVFMSWNALRQPHNDRHPMRRPPWVFVIFTAELVPIHVGALIVLTLIAWLTGGLDVATGRVAIVLLVVAAVLYALVFIRALESRQAMRKILREAGVSPRSVPVRLLDMLRAWPFAVPSDIERIEDIVYSPGAQLDVYRSKNHRGPSPALLQIHGGSWSGGNRRQQARPLMNELARRGWICVAVSYPLVPAATFPEQLIALKQALGWMRTHGRDIGIDPSKIAVTGGSAGGHLAALVALTANDPAYQPGFASVDTTVQAAVPLYGIFDLLNRQKTRDHFEVIPTGLMKATAEEAEERYRDASPLDQVRSDAPPFLVVHGASDSLVAPAESRLFARALKAVSQRPVLHVEIPGASHAFDAIPSLRTQFVVGGVVSFLEAAMADELEQTPQ